MRRFSKLVTAIAAVMILGGAAAAGEHSPIKVVKLSDGRGYATGSTTAALQTGGEIGCTVWGYGPLTSCRATDASGNTLICFSADQDMFTSVQSVSDHCAIAFTVTSAGVCQRMTLDKSSAYLETAAE